jgi:hypothetical protein
VLLVRVSIRNPCRETVPIYWWSNIAVEVHARTRVVAPADSALTHGYRTGLALSAVPCHNGDENSYPAAFQQARDYFYRVAPDARPWIGAFDEAGFGFFHTSTGRLRGRKLFAWGSGVGGRRWQRFLGTPDYIELQAGLARTQSHHVPLPAGATWSWVEAYGACTAEAEAVHGRDWSRARHAVASAIEATVPAARLERVLAESAGWADEPAGALWLSGSGWGALEELRRRRRGEPPLGPRGVRFPDESMGYEQRPWRSLLETGRFPTGDASCDTPGSYMVQADWRERLAQSLSEPGGRHWAALFHHGVMLWDGGRVAEAEAAWRESMHETASPWAAYALSVAARRAGRGGESIEWLARAHAGHRSSLALVLPYLKTLLEEKSFSRALRVVRDLPTHVRARACVRLVEGCALLGAGDLDGLEAWLADPPMPDDLREGDTQLSDLWFGFHEARATQAAGAPLDEAGRQRVRDAHPVPPALDFRMHA